MPSSVSTRDGIGAAGEFARRGIGVPREIALADDKRSCRYLRSPPLPSHAAVGTGCGAMRRWIWRERPSGPQSDSIQVPAGDARFNPRQGQPARVPTTTGRMPTRRVAGGE